MISVLPRWVHTLPLRRASTGGLRFFRWSLRCRCVFEFDRGMIVQGAGGSAATLPPPLRSPPSQPRWIMVGGRRPGGIGRSPAANSAIPTTHA